jgi:hypothetical protein
VNGPVATFEVFDHPEIVARRPPDVWRVSDILVGDLEAGEVGGLTRGILAGLNPRHLATLGVLAAAIGLAAAASFTKPFSNGADVVVAIPVVAMVIAQIVLIVGRRRFPRAERVPSPRKAFVAWIAVAAAVIAVELYTYLGHPRSAYPTLSSLSDELSHWRVAKAGLFVAWLALGWLFLSGSRRRAREAGPR